MAVENITRKTCDRCSRVIEESPGREDGDKNKTGPAVYAEFSGLKDAPSKIQFDDLCDKCEARCINLAQQLAKQSSPADETTSDKKKPGKGKGKGKGDKDKGDKSPDEKDDAI